MNSDKNTPRLLGAAFLLQAIASLVSTFLLTPLIVPGNITASMTNIANNATQMRASIVGEMIAVMGIVMLGALLYLTLKKQNRKIALVALGLYLVTAAIIAVSMNYRNLATFYICCPIPLGQPCSITYSTNQDFFHEFWHFGVS